MPPEKQRVALVTGASRGVGWGVAAGAYLDLFLERFVRLLPEGRYAVPLLARNRSLIEAETYAGSLAELTEVLGPAREPGALIRFDNLEAELRRWAEMA